MNRDADIDELMGPVTQGPGAIWEMTDRMSGLARLARQSRDERDAAQRERFVPGGWVCPKCGFTLQKNFLFAQDGTIGVNNEDVREVCRNDGVTLERQTWKARALIAEKIAMEEMERARNASVVDPTR